MGNVVLKPVYSVFIKIVSRQKKFLVVKKITIIN